MGVDVPFETKTVVCSSCDIQCPVHARVVDGQVIQIRTSDNPKFKDNICMKGVYAPKGFAHPDRVIYPMRRVGERGSGKFERVTWDEAMSDIGARLRSIRDEYGPEAVAVSTSDWNTSTENGATRRFTNLLGSPNFISGVALCAGNTAAVNRLTYGWFPYPDFMNTECIVLFGHNPKRHSWVPIYNNIMRAKARGAKLIVLDPRLSEMAERADVWLPLKTGTDAAICLGWINVIIEEGLYDADFVETWCHGFEQLRARAAEFPLERVSAITGVPPELIAASARLYASRRAIIPWTPITDQQRNSTSAIRLHSILRAICGNLDVQGGEILWGLNPDIPMKTTLEAHDMLSEAQRAKQLGADKHPVFTYRAMSKLEDATERVWGYRHINILNGSYMAVPSAVFRAMADGVPYPIKAFIAQGNNPLMSYASMKLIYRAMMNQDLVVVHEHFMTPSAQLADYVLPGDAWTERNALLDGFGWSANCKISQKAMEPPGECRGAYEFWRGIAGSVGLGKWFPWATNEEILDDRVKAVAPSFEALSKQYDMYAPTARYKKYEATGFATPTGKVELYSTVLDDLGFDPLPYWRGEPAPDARFPLSLFIGVREDEFFQTGHRHIPELRARHPEPLMFIHARTAAEHGLVEGEWVRVETKEGGIKLKVSFTGHMPEGLVRVPHGWWKPEMERGAEVLSGAWDFADAQICPDDDDYLDREQGIPHFKGIPCRLVKLTTDRPSDEHMRDAMIESEPAFSVDELVHLRREQAAAGARCLEAADEGGADR